MTDRVASDPLLSSLTSGVIRIEVSLPRGGCTALRWLQGLTGCTTAVGPACSHLSPHLYFSGRLSSAPDTPATALAEGCTKGWTAVAGVGAAWLWQGAPGSGFSPKVVERMQRFLSASCPRIRVIGGTRWEGEAAGGTRWG